VKVYQMLREMLTVKHDGNGGSLPVVASVTSVVAVDEETDRRWNGFSAEAGIVGRRHCRCSAAGGAAAAILLFSDCILRSARFDFLGAPSETIE
jgi:hypothetical protein